MTVSTAKSANRRAYLAGCRDGLPFTFVVSPFALLFGVVATDAGLGLAHAMGFSVLVIAGAAQFTAVQLMVENAALPLVLLAALAVNLRMAMYSASLVPYLGAAPLWQRALVSYMNFDQSFMVSMTRYQARPDMTVAARIAYFFGVATPIVPLWYIFTWVGITAGATIPQAWALDFALPITFLAMIGPALRSLAHVAAALVSVTVALLLAGLPSGFGLLLAGLAAMLAGAFVEIWQERRA